MNHTITTTGWLVAGTQRVKLDTVARYEIREAKVLLYGETWATALDCGPDGEADAQAILATLDAYFAPAVP